MNKLKKPSLFFIVLLSFLTGFAFNSIYFGKVISQNTARVTGIGGIFFKCEDPSGLKNWYETNLGITTNQYGAVFEWRQAGDSTKKGFSQWSPFNKKTKYFDKDFMINYRVNNLGLLLKNLAEKGIHAVDSLQADALGKFIHIMDPEGNKIELWEPDDQGCEDYGKKEGIRTNK